MTQLQIQLVVLALQMREVVKGKELRANVCCTIYHREGHHKNEFLELGNYASIGASDPFSGGGNADYYEICKKWGHNPTFCSTLEKYQRTYHTLFCEFCKSVEHDIQACHTLELMKERNSDAYRI